MPRRGVELGERRTPGGAGRGNQHVDRPDAGLDRVDHGKSLVRILQVCGEGVHPSRCGQRVLRSCEVGRVTGHDRHPRALGQEGVRTGQADAFAPAGDQDEAVGEVEVRGEKF